MAQATILADWSFEDVLARADRVVIGVVVERREIRLGDRPFTETEIRVERTLHGRPADRLVVTQFGGRIGRQRVRVRGDPKLPAGARVLVLTRRAGDGRDYLAAMSLSAYRFVGDRLRQDVDVPVVDDDGQVRPPPGQRWLDLDAVEAMIRGAKK